MQVGLTLLRNRRLRSRDRKSTRLNSSHSQISYAVFCLKKKRLNSSHSQISYAVFCLKKKKQDCEPTEIRQQLLKHSLHIFHYTNMTCRHSYRPSYGPRS